MPAGLPPAPKPVKRRNLIATIGTSTIGRGEANSGNVTQRTWGGIGNVFNILSRRGYIPQAYSRAVSGETSNEMANRQLNEVLALNPLPRGCLVQMASGDINNNLAWSVTRANLIKIIETLLKNDITPIICVAQAVLDYTTGQQRQMARLQRGMKDLAFQYPQCILVEPPTSFMNPALTTFEPLVTVMDSIAPRVHMNHLGTTRYALNIDLALADAGWNKIISPALLSNGDLYDATLNPRGTLMANGMLTGSGGSVIAATTNPTGVIPAGWSITGNSVGGTIVCAAGDPNGTAITVSGTAAAGTGIILYRDLSASELAQIQAGDTLEFVVEASWTNLTNVRYIGFTGRITESGVTYDDLDGAPGSNSGPLDAVASAIFRTVPRKVVAVPTVVRPRLFIYPEAAGSWSGTITFKSCAIRKV